MTDQADQQRVENLGPAERIIQTLLTHSDHLYHGRPGMVISDARTATGVRWFPVTHKEEEGEKVVYRLDQAHTGKTTRTRIGILRDDSTIRDGTRNIGRYQKPGLFNETATHLYKQVADIYRMDNEFVARWASYAFGQEHRDLKVVLAAFLLVQSRKGEPVKEDGVVLFHDEDYRDVGEAMVLLRRRDNNDINPKLLLRVGDVLQLSGVAQINRELGFGHSTRNPSMGRYTRAVTKWLRYREQNPRMLDGLVNAGFRRTIMKLAQRVGYKPENEQFFKTLRWKQKQAVDGRRTIAIGQEVEAAINWDTLSESEICQSIIDNRYNYKRVVGLLPSSGLTRAIMAATIEARGLSDNDLIILAPTLEELGLLQVQEIKTRFDTALARAENQRAANIAKRMRKQENVEALETAADNALQTKLEKVTRDLRVYFFVDISGSMNNAIATAKRYISKFMGGFPLDRIHVCVFNTTAREVSIPHASATGIAKAFSGFGAGGGTNYGSGPRAMAMRTPQDGEDTLFIFVGDQEQGPTFSAEVQMSGLNPVAFGMLHVGRQVCWSGRPNDAVERTAVELGVPCFNIDENMFNDPYAVGRTLTNLIASTPVGVSIPGQTVRTRKTLVEQILETDLLQKPVWA